MLGFRVWDVTEKEMYYGEPECFNPATDYDDEIWLAMSGKMCTYYSDEEESKLIPMQSTGQLDMDGKMIYEGDVISTGQGVIVYVSCVKNFYVYCMGLKLSHFKVIGNVYENEGLGVLKDAGV